MIHALLLGYRSFATELSNIDGQKVYTEATLQLDAFFD